MTGPVSPRRWEEIPLERLTEMASRRVIAGARQQLAHVWLKRGALVARQAHPAEQIVFVMDGAMRYRVDGPGEEVVLRTGDVLVIPANVPHQAIALDDSLVLQTHAICDVKSGDV
jgi:quercetin dioxygenase-like cupin family protein